jgi:hypothetical protein
MDCGWVSEYGIQVPPVINIIQGQSKEGRWNANTGYCVVCDSNRRKIEYFNCNGDYTGDYKCESACGANSLCDEVKPQGVSSDSKVYCDNDCNPYTCNANSECDTKPSGDIYDYFCVYDWSQVNNPQWKWVLPPLNNEDGNPWQECFDGYDNDCDGYKDCADPGCKGVQNPNTGTICCQSDSDCPSKNNIKGKCRSPQGSGGPPYDYTCVWPQTCQQDSECVSGAYCYCGVCSYSFTSAGCPNGQCCDRGYGGTSIGQCVSKGTIRNIASISYLCDPPEWNSGEENPEIKNESKDKKNIFESILSFFYSFFQR